MSWNTAKKRFQQNLDRYPEAIRASFIKKQNTHLPTFTPARHIPKLERLTLMEQVGLTSGDLVYVTEGPYKGKLSKVVQYSEEANTVLLADMVTPRIVPKDYWGPNQNSHMIEFPEDIPREHVKLAAKDKDDNGNISYVVADKIVMKGKYYDDRYKRWLPRRLVQHHESIEIPWPKPATEPEDDAISTGADTVFMKTYEAQTIAKSPLPNGVLNELRNPYSPYKKKFLTDAQARKLNGVQMPMLAEQKIYLAKKAKEPVKEVEPMLEEVKDFIGTKMAEHLSQIDNPALLAHLDAVSKSRIREQK